MKNFALFAIAATTLLFSCIKPSVSNEDILKKSFTQIEKQAQGTEVLFYMWGGSVQINSWVKNYLGVQLKELYDIELTLVPITDAAEFVNKLLTEKQAGRNKGSADLIWINGENFKNAKRADLLFGPYAQKLPNYVKSAPGAAELDFGFPTEGYEAPYGRAQFVFEYNPDKVKDVPISFQELASWIKENPGEFTYPQPPDFTGSAFIRQALYEVSGGPDEYLQGFDSNLYEKNAPALWDLLKEIEPYLWREGKTYPKSIAVLEDLFARGEVSMAMYYSPSHATSKIIEGTYPPGIKTFVMKGNSITNTHFTAIPFNAPNKAGALVVSNFILSFEAQLSKADPENWGDFPILDFNALSDEEKKAFESLDLGSATLPPQELGLNAVPEIPSAYLELLEEGWEENVLKK